MGSAYGASFQWVLVFRIAFRMSGSYRVAIAIQNALKIDLVQLASS